MTNRISWIYGFYHGQDPRCFNPDMECCSEKEVEAHRIAVAAAEAGNWVADDSGCHHVRGAIICNSSFGIGTYAYVEDEYGAYLRDATWEDLKS